MNIEIEEFLKNGKEIINNINLDLKNEILPMKDNLLKSVFDGIQKTAKYIIKGLPVPDAVKDILLDVNDSLKTFDLKNIVSTALNSSIREGLELIGIKSSKISSVEELKNIAIKGGLQNNLKAAVEIAGNRFLDKNLVSDDVKKFVNELKQSMQNNFFVENIDKSICKVLKQKENIKNNIESWYKAYNELDYDNINKISNALYKNKSFAKNEYELQKEIKIIQNMTKMINNKNERLSDLQLKLCETL